MPAELKHAEGIAVVQHDCWLATYPNEEIGISRATIEMHVSNYQSPERIAKWRDIIVNREHVTVALEGFRVIGFSCAKSGDDINHLAAIYVLPEYHGTGIAQKLMTAAMSWFGGNKDTLVEVVSYNARAMRFYEKYGFVVTSELGQHDLLPTILMRRPAGLTET